MVSLARYKPGGFVDFEAPPQHAHNLDSKTAVHFKAEGYPVVEDMPMDPTLRIITNIDLFVALDANPDIEPTIKGHVRSRLAYDPMNFGDTILECNVKMDGTLMFEGNVPRAFVNVEVTRKTVQAALVQFFDKCAEEGE